MRRLLVTLLLAAPSETACELPGGAAPKIQAGHDEVLYRTHPSLLKVGQYFTVDFAVCPAPESVRVDAWMPEHKHGMNYRPTIAATGEGRYRAEGLMLHMAGKWELVFEVRAKDKVERVAQIIQLE